MIKMFYRYQIWNPSVVCTVSYKPSSKGLPNSTMLYLTDLVSYHEDKCVYMAHSVFVQLKARTYDHEQTPSPSLNEM